MDKSEPTPPSTRTCPAFLESVEFPSRTFRAKATGLWKSGDDCRLMGSWNPSTDLVTTFSARWRDCRATGQISTDVMVLKTVSTIAASWQFARPLIKISMPLSRRGA
jgi:hypothetical protein